MTQPTKNEMDQLRKQLKDLEVKQTEQHYLIYVLLKTLWYYEHEEKRLIETMAYAAKTVAHKEYTEVSKLPPQEMYGYLRKNVAQQKSHL
jgi:hypothetical protein